MKKAITKVGFFVFIASASLVSTGRAAEEWPFLRHYNQRRGNLMSGSCGGA